MARQAGAGKQEIEISLEMAAAGSAAYRMWLADPLEQKKLNSAANLAARVYRAMESQRHQSE